MDLHVAFAQNDLEPLQLALASLLAAMITAAAVAHEKDRRTLVMLLCWPVFAAETSADLAYLEIEELQNRMHEGTLTSVELVAFYVQRIAEIAWQVNEKTENIGARRLATHHTGHLARLVPVGGDERDPDHVVAAPPDLAFEGRDHHADADRC